VRKYDTIYSYTISGTFYTKIMLLFRYFSIGNKLLTNIRKTLLFIAYNVMPYVCVIIFCILVNLICLNHFIRIQQERDEYILKTYISDISINIVNDFKNALGNNSINLSFFKIFNGPLNSFPINNPIYFNGNNIYISNNSGVLMLKRNNLETFLNSKLPPYVDYQILFNQIEISSNKKRYMNIGAYVKHEIKKGNYITINLGIDKNHPTYVSAINTLYHKVLIALIISIFLSVSLLYFYLKQLRKLNMRINVLECDLVSNVNRAKHVETILTKMVDSLLHEKQAEQHLKRLFIKNATAVYLDNNIPNMNSNQKQINSLSNILFPIVFIEPANDEEIDVNEVIKYLTDYLAFESTKYEIKFDKQVATLTVQCSYTVFYQILFSLATNFIQLMPPISDNELPSESKKKFTITFQEEKVIIDYESFPLNSDQVASFLQKKGYPIDAFLLDYKRVLESLKAHNIEHHISTHQNYNRFELDFKKRIPKGPPKLRIVE